MIQNDIKFLNQVASFLFLCFICIYTINKDNKMITPITFTSTYSASSKQNGYSKFSSFYDYALEKEASNNVDVLYDTLQDDSYPYSTYEDCTIIAPGLLDYDIELYCMYNGINYKKFIDEELLSPDNIDNRIEDAKAGMRIAYINSDKLEKLIKKQDSNFEHCKKDYDKYYNERTEVMIRSGKQIPATTLYITPSHSNVEDTLQYIDNFGAESLNSQQLLIDFAQRTDYPDHCIYFALKDLGMKNIPVYMNKNTYKSAQALDVLE